MSMQERSEHHGDEFLGVAGKIAEASSTTGRAR
jgi:hypothetical protein